MDKGKSLRIAMAMGGVRNKDLAKDLGVTTQQVTNWLSGKMSMANIELLSEHFGVKVSEFIARGED